MKKLISLSLVAVMLTMYSTIASAATLNGYKWNNPHTLTVCNSTAMTNNTNNAGIHYSAMEFNASYSWYTALGSNLSFSYSSSGCQISSDANNYGNISWDGLTNYTSPGGTYLSATTLTVNTYHTNAYSQSKTEGVLAHEFGHSLGLSDVSGSSNTSKLMYFSSARTSSTPQTDESSAIKTLYGW